MCGMTMDHVYIRNKKNGYIGHWEGQNAVVSILKDKWNSVPQMVDTRK